MRQEYLQSNMTLKSATMCSCLNMVSMHAITLATTVCLSRDWSAEAVQC